MALEVPTVATILHVEVPTMTTVVPALASPTALGQGAAIPAIPVVVKARTGEGGGPVRTTNVTAKVLPLALGLVPEVPLAQEVVVPDLAWAAPKEIPLYWGYY